MMKFATSMQCHHGRTKRSPGQIRWIQATRPTTTSPNLKLWKFPVELELASLPNSL